MLDKSFKTLDIYNRALNTSWLRNEVISNNIANVNTPNYKKRIVTFDNILKEKMLEMEKTNDAHMDVYNSDKPRIITDDRTSLRKDGNNVNIDTEQAELAANQLYFQAVTQEVNSKLKRLRTAIK